MNYMRYYVAETHDNMTAADAAADIADSIGIEEEDADLAIHTITQQIISKRRK